MVIHQLAIILKAEVILVSGSHNLLLQGIGYSAITSVLINEAFAPYVIDIKMTIRRQKVLLKDYIAIEKEG